TNTAPSPAKPSSAAWPEPSPTPPPRSPSPSNDPPHGTSHAPWPCSPTRSTPPRPPCPATPAPSPTSSPATGFNCNQPTTAGGLSPARSSNVRFCTAPHFFITWSGCSTSRDMGRCDQYAVGGVVSSG